jgi:hypothetical protein
MEEDKWSALDYFLISLPIIYFLIMGWGNEIINKHSFKKGTISFFKSFF